jgi:hypothetical protein
MIGNSNQQLRLFRMPQVMMAPSDMVHNKAGALQGSDELAWSNNWKTIHSRSMATATVSLIMSPRGGGSSGGIGSPSWARLSRYPRIASAAMSRASSNVSPSVTNPGKDGQVTTYPPSSAGSNKTVYRYWRTAIAQRSHLTTASETVDAILCTASSFSSSGRARDRGSEKLLGAACGVATDYASAGLRRSGVSGARRRRAPVASKTALAMAAATGRIELSCRCSTPTTELTAAACRSGSPTAQMRRPATA